MASIEELKEMIVELKLELIKSNIPDGNCPYAYYLTDRRKDIDCCVVGCDYCQDEFLGEIADVIREEVEAL